MFFFESSKQTGTYLLFIRKDWNLGLAKNMISSLKQCFLHKSHIEMSSLESCFFVHFVLSAIWLPHSQLWAIIAGQPDSRDVNHFILSMFDPKITIL